MNATTANGLGSANLMEAMYFSRQSQPWLRYNRTASNGLTARLEMSHYSTVFLSTPLLNSLG